MPSLREQIGIDPIARAGVEGEPSTKELRADTVELRKAASSVATLLIPLVTQQTTAAYTAEGRDEIIVCNTTANAITVTLPLASDEPGRVYEIKLIRPGVNNLTIARTGADTIDGAASLVLNTNLQSRILRSDGNGRWHVVGGYL